MSMKEMEMRIDVSYPSCYSSVVEIENSTTSGIT